MATAKNRPSGLDGKGVLITGASGGIGRATALCCAREGASLVLSDIDEKGCDETARLVSEVGGEVHVSVEDSSFNYAFE